MITKHARNILWIRDVYNTMKFCYQVIAATADKASPNMRLIDMLGGHRTENLYTPGRCIWLISDPPHLIKTTRNNLGNSGSGLNSRYLQVSKCQF